MVADTQQSSAHAAHFTSAVYTADEIAEYSEKQKFLKAVYEDFYKAYNPAAADRLGVVYTPNEFSVFQSTQKSTVLVGGRSECGRAQIDINRLGRRTEPSLPSID